MAGMLQTPTIQMIAMAMMASIGSPPRICLPVLGKQVIQGTFGEYLLDGAHFPQGELGFAVELLAHGALADADVRGQPLLGILLYFHLGQ